MLQNGKNFFQPWKPFFQPQNVFSTLPVFFPALESFFPASLFFSLGFPAELFFHLAWFFSALRSQGVRKFEGGSLQKILYCTLIASMLDSCLVNHLEAPRSPEVWRRYQKTYCTVLSQPPCQTGYKAVLITKRAVYKHAAGQDTCGHAYLLWLHRCSPSAAVEVVLTSVSTLFLYIDAWLSLNWKALGAHGLNLWSVTQKLLWPTQLRTAFAHRWNEMICPWLAVLLLGCGRLSVRENWWLFFQLIFWNSAFVLRGIGGVNLASIKWRVVLQLNELLVARYRRAKLFIIVAVGSSNLRHISWSYRCTTPWMLSTPACSKFTTICMNMAKPFFPCAIKWSVSTTPVSAQCSLAWHLCYTKYCMAPRTCINA